MFSEKDRKFLETEIDTIKKAGAYKAENPFNGPQGVHLFIRRDNRPCVNLCSNNYLGWADSEELRESAHQALEDWGFGLASVPFICGVQEIHKTLERKMSAFLGTEDTILFSCCFKTNVGLFQALFDQEDAIISDQLNHGSIIDGIRLCKAKRFRFRHSDMKDLEEQLKQTKEARLRIIVTDGIFSMDGDIANLPEICRLAEKYKAWVMVDDSHATGVIGPAGRGSPEHHGVEDKIDIITSTFGKALGGAAGGFASGRKEIIEMLRQRSRSYLLSNALPPTIVVPAIKAMEMLKRDFPQLKTQLDENTKYFRQKIQALGFTIVEGATPIIPIMLYEERLAQEMAAKLRENGVYVIAFSYPVVPRGEARIRVQLSAIHTRKILDFALGKFEKVAKEIGIMS